MDELLIIDGCPTQISLRALVGGGCSAYGL